MKKKIHLPIQIQVSVQGLHEASHFCRKALVLVKVMKIFKFSDKKPTSYFHEIHLPPLEKDPSVCRSRGFSRFELSSLHSEFQHEECLATGSLPSD